MPNDKPPFDPNKPFDMVGQSGGKPKFDPNKPFESGIPQTGQPTTQTSPQVTPGTGPLSVQPQGSQMGNLGVDVYEQTKAQIPQVQEQQPVEVVKPNTYPLLEKQEPQTDLGKLVQQTRTPFVQGIEDPKELEKVAKEYQLATTTKEEYPGQNKDALNESTLAYEKLFNIDQQEQKNDPNVSSNLAWNYMMQGDYEKASELANISMAQEQISLRPYSYH